MRRAFIVGLVAAFTGVTAPHPALAAEGRVGRAAPACRAGQVATKVRAGGFGAGSYGMSVLFSLRPGQRQCTLSGYPEVTLTTTSRSVVAQPHSPQGSTVTLTATQGASASLYWYERVDNPPTEHCPTVTGFLITPPGVTRAVHRSMSRSVTICGPANIDGVQPPH